ncbi:hypothetical protein [Lysinibacillus capsici]|uniref:hypothetical protein n=1 Tax=Lysinibacillus capsici TaxID=2115968 RepID=UPI0028B0F634|nr:hypothetical protein [Lysinibacillus capsici]
MKIDKNEIKQIGIEAVLTSATSQGADAIKETGLSLLGEILTDTAASLIPGVAGAYASYKRTRLQRNIDAFAEELASEIERLSEIFHLKTIEQKTELDRLYELVLEYVIDEPQVEKIEYLVNGFLNIAEHEEIKEDFVLVYYDTLKDLRIIDVTVLKLYGRYYMNSSEADINSYQDVLDKHGISYEQYETIRRNLVRKGILTTKTDIILEKDLEAIEKAINELQSFVLKATNPKNKSRLPTLKGLKLKSKDTLELTKFGRDFIRYFLEENKV